MQGNPHLSLPQGSLTGVDQSRTPSSTFSFIPLDSSVHSNIAVSALLSSAVSPATVVVTGQQQCIDSLTDDQSGKYTICADSQLSYVGTNQVEPYAHMSWNLTNIYLSYLWVQGLFYVNGSFHDNLGCNQYSSTANYCIHSPNVSLDSGNNALYQWQAKTTIGYFNADCVVSAYCYTYTNSVTSNSATVRILYPVVTSITPSSLTPGANGTLTISGTGLVSPFQNSPTVTTSNQSTVFGSIAIQSYNYLLQTINISYSVKSTAPSGAQTITINNGFGSGTATINILPPPPTPEIMFNGSDETNQTTTVVVGQQIHLSAQIALPQGQTIQSQSWTVPGTAIAGYTANLNQGTVVPLTDKASQDITFYWVYPQTSSQFVTYTCCLSNGACLPNPVHVSFTVDGPTSVSMTATAGSPEATFRTFATGTWPALAFGDPVDPDVPAGMLFRASVTSPQIDPTGGLLAVQLVSRDSWFELTSDGVSTIQYAVSPSNPPVLDVTADDLNYPYEDTGSNILKTSDSPDIRAEDDEGELQRNFSATMFLMWDPVLPSGCFPATSQSATQCSSIPVPLGYISWQFSGAMTNTLNTQSSPNSDGAPNNTTWIVNSCGGCNSPLTFYPSQASQNNYGYPTWQANDLQSH